MRRLEFFSGSVTLSAPWHLGDLRGSHSKQPADCPFAPSLRSKPRGPVITRQPRRGGHAPTVRSFHRTICVASAVCLCSLTHAQCTALLTAAHSAFCLNYLMGKKKSDEGLLRKSCAVIYGILILIASTTSLPVFSARD